MATPITEEQLAMTGHSISAAGTGLVSGRAPSLYDLTRPEVIADPWPWYAQLRQRGPVLWDPYTGSWLVTRHADITGILSNRDTYTGWMDHQTRVGQAPAAMRRVFGYLDRIV